MGPKLEDVPELIQNIQSRLPVTEGARTSLVSKSWLHAWSTIPTLMFDVGSGKSMNMSDLNRILIRYLRENIPFETLDLMIDIEDQESAFDAEKMLGPIATRSCLRELSLSILLLCDVPFTMSGEILSGENLTKIMVSASPSLSMTISQHPVPIKCVSLRELHLDGVCVSEEVLNDILSSCCLLEKIVLSYSCKGFET